MRQPTRAVILFLLTGILILSEIATGKELTHEYRVPTTTRDSLIRILKKADRTTRECQAYLKVLQESKQGERDADSQMVIQEPIHK